jgi:hypothetical protein
MLHCLAVFVFVLALGPTALAQPIDLGDTGDPVAASEAFARRIAARYPLGGDYAAARADAASNGFVCEDYPPAPGADAPTAECVRSVGDGACVHEWAIELRAADGKLRASAVGSFARMCVGAVLPPKRRKD